MIHTQYACLEIPNISSKEQLAELLKVYAEQILEMPDPEPDSYLAYFQDDNKGLSKEEATNTILSQLMRYINIGYISDQSASVIVQADYEGDAGNYDLCDEITKFLFTKTAKPYFLMRSAEADRGGAYAHQWIGYWNSGEVVLEKTETYFDRLFASNADPRELGNRALKSVWGRC